VHPTLVVFDLDGTLIDSAPDMHRAVNLMLAGLGCAPLTLADIRSMVGDGASALIARALAARQCVSADPSKALAQFLAHYEEEPTASTTKTCTPSGGARRCGSRRHSSARPAMRREDRARPAAGA